jgi:hypothetical protein
MRKLNLITFLGLTALGTTLMFGQATSRTWVSSFGDDANPCSRTAPCQTFAGAMAQTVAGGEIDVLDPGSFGVLTITKALTIDGGRGQVASILASGADGIILQAGTNDVVTLRNLSINGTNGAGHINGIRFLSGKELHIEHCSILGFSNAGIDIEPTAGGKIFVDDTISADNAFAGLFVQAGALASVDVYRSRFQANGIHGIWASSNSNVSVRDSDASGNAGEGFIAFANSGTAALSLTNSSANGNGTGVQAGGTGSQTATVQVTGISLSNNGTGFSAQTNGTIKSFGNNYNSGTGTPTAGQNIPPQ